MITYPNSISVTINPGAYFERVPTAHFVQNKPLLSQHIRLISLEVDSKTGLPTASFVLPDYVLSNGVAYLGRYNKDEKFIAVQLANMVLPKSTEFYIHLYVEHLITPVFGNSDLVNLLVIVHFVLTDSWLEPYQVPPTLKYYGCIKVTYDSETDRYKATTETFIEELYAGEYADKPVRLYVVMPDNPLYLSTFGLLDEEIVVTPLVEGYDNFEPSDVTFVKEQVSKHGKQTGIYETEIQQAASYFDVLLDANNTYSSVRYQGLYTITEHIVIGAPTTTDDLITILLEDEFFQTSLHRKVSHNTFAY